MILVIECRYNLMIALRLNIDSSLKEQITLLHDYKAYGVIFFDKKISSSYIYLNSD